MLDEFTSEPRIAYFTMEIALRNEIPTYSGGLGILAGDTLRSSADLELPLIGVSLVSRAGYFRQEIAPDGSQIEHPIFWEPRDWCAPSEAKIAVEIDGNEVWVRGWIYILQSQAGGREPVLLLDTDLNENRPEDREITHYLYGGDEAYRLKQEIILGIGGVRLLYALGFHIRQFHMNEGHSALLALELLRRNAYPVLGVRPGESPYDIPQVRELCNFTTHTPVEAASDRFSYDLVRKFLGDFVELRILKSLAGESNLNMTQLALNLSEYVNGVARSHAEVAGKMYPGYHVHAVTNGIHPFTWVCPNFSVLYDTHLPGWAHEPDYLVRADRLPDDSVWEAHTHAKRVLLDRVNALCGANLDPDKPILGFARRMTAYKRPDLLFSDLERLKAIASRHPFQIMLAGKAHPRDNGGKELIKLLHRHMAELAGAIPIVFLPNYDMEIAQYLVAGVDVWLNTPLRPLEASGTSGMKAALNGVPNLSVLDGWWIEGWIEDVTGWAVCGTSDCSENGDAQSLYDKLENKVLPLYYDNRPGWIAVMKGAIGKNASYFNSHRMMRRYATEAYIR
ncbi:MAG: alpha-glucan family phosphorylase [Sulfuricella sp.]|nr:alpha-glucan family phosphorylase [Sulfuricella sp.]